MRKAVCIRKCFSGGKVYSVGEFKTFADDAQINRNFEFVDAAPVVALPPAATVKVTVTEQKRYNPMEPVTYKINQPVVPRGGMATGLSTAPIKPMPTAGSEAIRKASEEAKQETSVLAPIIKQRGRPRKV